MNNSTESQCFENATLEWLDCSGCGRLQPREAAWWRAAVVFLVSLLAVPTNLLVIVIVYQTPALRTNQGIYMLCLAISDLGTGVWFLAFCFRYAVSGYGPRSPVELDIGAWIYYVTLTTALCFTVAIGMDKLHQIKWPYSYDRVMTRRKVSAITGGIWTGIAVLSTLPTRIVPISGYYYEFTGSSLMFNTRTCRAGDRSQADVSMVITRTSLILFMVVILVLGYGILLLISRRHVRSMQRMQECAAPLQPRGAGAGGDGAASKWERRRSGLRGWITNACVILGFLVFWLPFFIYKIAIATEPAGQATETGQFCVIWFAMNYTSINAAIYGGTYKPFKKGMRRFFRRIRGKPLADREEIFLSQRVPTTRR